MQLAGSCLHVRWRLLAGMEHSLGLNEDVGPRGSFPGFWQNTKGEDAAAAGLAAATAAGAASFAAGKGKSHHLGFRGHCAIDGTARALKVPWPRSQLYPLGQKLEV